MRSILALFFLLLAVAAPLSGAAAAPQMLGLIASKGPVPLSCAGGTCTAELSSFCLQRDRDVPPVGTAYRPVDGTGLTLVATLADGHTRRLPAGDRLRIESERNYTAVAVEVDAGDLAASGVISVALEIGDGVALAPMPAAGDPWPQTEADVALAVEALRPAGTQIVDRSEAAAAAGALNRIVTALSPDAHAVATPRGPLWHDRVGRHAGPGESAGHALAGRIYRDCYRGEARDSDARLRWCLQVRHDALIIELNSDYWAAVRTGS